MKENLILSDAHAHVGTKAERQERRDGGIVSLVCASTPMEAEEIFSYGGEYLIPTCGVHPWHAKEWGFESMKKWMERCSIIGEIGMDSVWCSVSLGLQEDVFRRQLDMACRQKKPVILHTKGQEEKIARIIRAYPNRYLVHWYSCENYLEEYMNQDCYFSIGPDVWWNQAVMEVVRKVPRNRLLMETDGLGAVKWAYEEGRKAWERKTKAGEWREDMTGRAETVHGISVSEALAATLETAAGILNIRTEDAGKMFKENLVAGFLGRTDRDAE